MRLVFHDQFREDLFQAAEYLQTRSPESALGFVREAEAVIDRIVENPELAPRWRLDVRCALLRKFPYGIHYQIKGNREAVRILGLYHQARRPSVGPKRR